MGGERDVRRDKEENKDNEKMSVDGRERKEDKEEEEEREEDGGINGGSGFSPGLCFYRRLKGSFSLGWKHLLGLKAGIYHYRKIAVCHPFLVSIGNTNRD
jgi:hypothetical protein